MDASYFTLGKKGVANAKNIALGTDMVKTLNITMVIRTSYKPQNGYYAPTFYFGIPRILDKFSTLDS